MSRVVLALAVTAAFMMASCSSSKQSRARTEDRDTSQAYLGTSAAEFVGLDWLNSDPITLASLKGKNVLLHFWHGNCSFCRDDIDGLTYLQKSYGPRGLVVIAIHDSSRTSAEIKDLIEKWCVKFPVALDGDWNTTKKYQFTNTSNYRPGYFLIDGNGIITRVRHPHYLSLPARLGGVSKHGDFDSLELAINGALSPKKAAREEILPPLNQFSHPESSANSFEEQS